MDYKYIGLFIKSYDVRIWLAQNTSVTVLKQLPTLGKTTHMNQLTSQLNELAPILRRIMLTLYVENISNPCCALAIGLFLSDTKYPEMIEINSNAFSTRHAKLVMGRKADIDESDNYDNHKLLVCLPVLKWFIDDPALAVVYANELNYENCIAKGTRKEIIAVARTIAPIKWYYFTSKIRRIIREHTVGKIIAALREV